MLIQVYVKMSYCGIITVHDVMTSKARDGTRIRQFLGNGAVNTTNVQTGAQG
jgi:hypothetical protein